MGIMGYPPLAAASHDTKPTNRWVACLAVLLLAGCERAGNPPGQSAAAPENLAPPTNEQADGTTENGPPAVDPLAPVLGVWRPDPTAMQEILEKQGASDLQRQAAMVKLGLMHVELHVSADEVRMDLGTEEKVVNPARIYQPVPGDFLVVKDADDSDGLMFRVLSPGHMEFGHYVDGVFTQAGLPMGRMWQPPAESPDDTRARLRTLALFDRIRRGIALHVQARRQDGAEKELFPPPDDDLLTASLWQALKGDLANTPEEFIGTHPDDAARTVIVDGWRRPIRYTPWDRRAYKASEAINPGLFDLRSAGADGIHGTWDDVANVEKPDDIPDPGEFLRKADLERARAMVNLIVASLEVYWLENRGYNGIEAGPAINNCRQLDLDRTQFDGWDPFTPEDFRIEFHGSGENVWRADVVVSHPKQTDAELRVTVDTFSLLAPDRQPDKPPDPQTEHERPEYLALAARFGNSVSLRNRRSGEVIVSDSGSRNLKVGDTFRMAGEQWKLVAIDPEAASKA